ncbi:MAG: hypothetical protein AAE987_06465 [Thermoplasmataceae archaeon]
MIHGESPLHGISKIPQHGTKQNGDGEGVALIDPWNRRSEPSAGTSPLTSSKPFSLISELMNLESIDLDLQTRQTVPVTSA